jgi:hypothetical protein
MSHFNEVPKGSLPMKKLVKNTIANVSSFLLTSSFFLFPIFIIVEQEKIPSYSTLNLDVIPKPDFIQSLEKYQAKIDPELMKEMLQGVGVKTSDERIYKMMSAMVESKLLSILKEVR